MPKFDAFQFNSQQRAGIFVLSLLIIAMQLILFFVEPKMDDDNSLEKEEWLSFQTQIDSLKLEKAKLKTAIQPFNPNFITDFKGYRLGMSSQEIDRLLAFRKNNQYVNSASEFQSVTKISDSLLREISPYFKFPDWVTNAKSRRTFDNNQQFGKKEKLPIIDINQATQDDLIKVYGIGVALSERILKQKELLGGFVNMEQMEHIWGLSPEVVELLKQKFTIRVFPDIKKIKINEASSNELSQFPYFRYPISKEIITFRSMNGGIKNIDDLTKIKGISVEKVNIIALYLEF